MAEYTDFSRWKRIVRYINSSAIVGMDRYLIKVSGKQLQQGQSGDAGHTRPQ